MTGRVGILVGKVLLVILLAIAVYLAGAYLRGGHQRVVPGTSATVLTDKESLSTTISGDN